MHASCVLQLEAIGTGCTRAAPASANELVLPAVLRWYSTGIGAQVMSQCCGIRGRGRAPEMCKDLRTRKKEVGSGGGKGRLKTVKVAFLHENAFGGIVLVRARLAMYL